MSRTFPSLLSLFSQMRTNPRALVQKYNESSQFEYASINNRDFLQVSESQNNYKICMLITFCYSKDSYDELNELMKVTTIFPQLIFVFVDEKTCKKSENH